MLMRCEICHRHYPRNASRHFHVCQNCKQGDYSAFINDLIRKELGQSRTHTP